MSVQIAICTLAVVIALDAIAIVAMLVQIQRALMCIAATN